MKIKKNKLIITGILLMFLIWAFILVEKGTDLLKGIDLYIFILIMVVGIFAFVKEMKKYKEEKAGIPLEDELTTRLKYKSGYQAYMASMYLWLFIFLLRDKFPDIETMLGGGILLSAFIGYISKMIVKFKFNE